jgi:hypothetical protein
MKAGAAVILGMVLCAWSPSQRLTEPDEDCVFMGLLSQRDRDFIDYACRDPELVSGIPIMWTVWDMGILREILEQGAGR